MAECLVCGVTFDAKSKRASFCSAKCRKRASRTGVRAIDSGLPADSSTVTSQNAPGGGAVTLSVADALREVPDGDWRKVVCLTLAARLDNNARDTAAGVAAVTSSLQRVMGDLLAEIGGDDFLSELRADMEADFRGR